MKQFKLFLMDGSITTIEGNTIGDALALRQNTTDGMPKICGELHPNDCQDLKWFQEVSSADGFAIQS